MPDRLTRKVKDKYWVTESDAVSVSQRPCSAPTNHTQTDRVTDRRTDRESERQIDSRQSDTPGQRERPRHRIRCRV